MSIHQRSLVKKPVDIASELLDIYPKFQYLEKTIDNLKTQLRNNLANKYILPGKGKVVVTGVETKARTEGVQVVFDTDKFLMLSEKVKSELIKTGLVKIEPKVVRASSPRVTITLEK